MFGLIMTTCVALLVSTGCLSVADKNTIALVNKKKIFLSSYEDALVRLGHVPGRDFSKEEAQRALLKEMIDEELLAQEAIRKGLLHTSDRLRREIAREYLYETIGRARYEPTEEELSQYFNQNRQTLEQVSVSHILIRPDKSGDVRSESVAKKKAQSIWTMIQEASPHADFARYAKKHSQDPANKDQGGDLGFFARDKMVPPFSAAAFALKNIGDVSNVVETQFGYHIIKLTGARRGLDFFRQHITSVLAAEKQREKASVLLQNLRSKASIKIFEDTLRKAKSPSSLFGAPHTNTTQGQ